jgi:hypothetical protein
VLAALQQPLTPVIIKAVGAPTEEVSVVNILVGGLGLTGLFVLGAALLGFVIGALLIGYKRLRPSNSLNGQTGASRGLNLDSFPPET